jgi:AbrB family looped-hinge helix DNA binding protein
MDTVTISPKFQVVIPQKIRKAMQLVPGQKVQVVLYGNRIELVPEKNIKEMRGFLKGINTDFQREGDRV